MVEELEACCEDDMIEESEFCCCCWLLAEVIGVMRLLVDIGEVI